MSTAIRIALLHAWLTTLQLAPDEATMLLAAELARSDEPLDVTVCRLTTLLREHRSAREHRACERCERLERQLDALRGRLVWERLARRQLNARRWMQ
jgi:hypothetical protein